MKPLYEKIYDYVESKIITGDLTAGDKLPSENELAEMFSTTRVTVRNALSKLEHEGLISKTKGLGTFVNTNNPLSKKRIGVIAQNNDIVRGIVKFTSMVGMRTYALDYSFNVQEEEKLIISLLEKGIDGLILQPTLLSVTNSTLKELILEKFPIVFVDRPSKGLKNVPVVWSENFNGGVLAAEHALELNVKNPLYVSNKDFEIETVKSRYNGFCKIYGERIEVFNIIDEKKDMEKFVKKIKKDCVDFIFFSNDSIAIRGISILNYYNIKIPEQVKVMGFDNIDASLRIFPEMTTLNQNFEQIGEETAFTLIKLLKKESVVLDKKIPVKLIKRTSTSI